MGDDKDDCHCEDSHAKSNGAGRVRFSMPEQALCFLAGANSIFTGEKLLTTPNNDFDADQLMFKMLGLIPKAPSFDDVAKNYAAEHCEEAISSSG
ncbi:uncharacterized protein J3R85_021077 [Psidium guajava]|nr:uncharacterized protein J3R85_021077 [Psidium guajava]